ncbi:hypothetical protein KCU71_g14449, partial [Aureobasidium melanogenum]
MSTQMPRERLRRSGLEGSTSLTQELDDHQQRYPDLWDTPTIPIFHFLNNLSSETSLDTRLKYLQVLLPNAELQVEDLLDPDSGPDDMAVTFPDFDYFRQKSRARHAAASCERLLKTTWEEFGTSVVTSVLMQHIDTVTFSMKMKEPSIVCVTAHFDGKGRLLRTEVDSIGLEDAYDRLDREYIELEINKRAILWTEAWRPPAMNFDVIELMATDLRRMYQEMVDFGS